MSTAARRARERTAIPAISFPEELPVSRRRDEIARADRRAPGGHRLRRNRLGQDDAAAQDLPLDRARRAGADRPHAAAAHRRLDDRAPHRAGTGYAAGRGGRLQGPLHRQDPARRVGQADDRRDPARRDADRSRTHRLRHDHHRRGPRAIAEHRFPARLPEAAAAAPAGPEGDHHVGDDRRRSLRGAFRSRRHAGAGAQRVRPTVSGRGPLPAVPRRG